LNAAEGQSIWNMQLATASRIRVLAPDQRQKTGLAFSSDGSYLYYLSNSAGRFTLYRVGVLGGSPVPLIENIGGAFSVSADGKRVAFIRTDLSHAESALMVAGLDGGGSRIVATLRRKQYFSPHGLAWSPDGRAIACFAGEAAGIGNRQFHLAAVTVSDGTVTDIGKHSWRWVESLIWPAHGKTLAFVASEQLNAFQVWTATLPGGETSRVTNDISQYSGLSATADAQTLIALQTQRLADLWVSPPRDNAAAVQVTFGSIHQFNTLDWTPDGRIVYSAMAGDDGEVWIADADGHNLKQLSTGPGNKDEVAVTRDQRYILYNSLGHIWRMDINGTGPRRLTHGVLEVHPTPSADGRFVLYGSFNEWSPGLGGKPTIWKVPIDGGESIAVSQEPASIPQVSSDGKWIVCPYFPDWQTGVSPRTFAVLDDAGRVRKVVGGLPPGGPIYRWTPDGKAIGYWVTSGGVSNIWRQPFGGGEAVQVTHFDHGDIFDFGWSRDGRLALARGEDVSGVALMKYIGN
jgi:Tol biopolymer transport system component